MTANPQTGTHVVYIMIILVELIKGNVVIDIQSYEQRRREPASQSQNVQRGIKFMSEDVAKSNFEVTF